MSILAWYDGQLQLQKGDHIRILRGINEGDRIRVTTVKNETSGMESRSRIEGVLMSTPPRDLSPVIEGLVESIMQNANTTHFELKEISYDEAYTFDIFISYDSGHEDVAKYFDDSCKAWDLNSFLALRSLEPGEDFVERLKEGLDSSYYVVPIFTLEATESQWVSQEIGYAVKLGKDKRKEIHPIRCEGVSIEGFIRNIHATNYETNWEVTFGKFFDFIRIKMKESPSMQNIKGQCLQCSEVLNVSIPEQSELETLRRESKPVIIKCRGCGETISLSPYTFLPVTRSTPPHYTIPTRKDIPHDIRLLHTNDLKQLFAEWKNQIPYPIATPECPGGLLPVKRLQMDPSYIKCAEKLEIEDHPLFSDLPVHIPESNLLDNWNEFKRLFGEFEGLKQSGLNRIMEKAVSHFGLPVDKFKEKESLSPHLPLFIYNWIIEKIQRGEEEANTRLAWDRKIEPRGKLIDFWVGAAGMIRIFCTDDDYSRVEKEIWGKWDGLFEELQKDGEFEAIFDSILTSLKVIEELRNQINVEINKVLSYPMLPGTCKYLELGV